MIANNFQILKHVILNYLENVHAKNKPSILIMKMKLRLIIRIYQQIQLQIKSLSLFRKENSVVNSKRGTRMNAIWAAAAQTPWWVYVLFIFLVQRGLVASKPQVISIIKLTILPIVFIALSVHTLMTAFHVNATVIVAWLVSVILGSVIGWFLIRNHEFKVDRKNLLIRLPGSWITLILILIIFVSKYYFEYQL